MKLPFGTSSFNSIASALSIGLATFKPAPESPALQAVAPAPVAGLERPLSSTHASGSSCDVPSYDVNVANSNWTFEPFDLEKASLYRYRRQRGVNLGGWFVAEAWMEPDLFKCAVAPASSEHDILQGYGVQASKPLMERHWDTWINESDFAYLSSIGINQVRLPIGYWHLPGRNWTDGTPFAQYASVYEGAWPRILRTIGFAAKYGIGVVVDMHGSYGSANGGPISGVSTSQVHFYRPAEEAKQTDALVWLVKQFAEVNNVVGIELINEPRYRTALLDYYDVALPKMREASLYAATLPFYTSDGFNSTFPSYLSGRSDFVVEDYHAYFTYTESDTSESARKHTQDLGRGGSSAKFLEELSTGTRGDFAILEWSCALSPSSLAKASNQEKAREVFCKAEMELFDELAAAWSFWSYRKATCDEGWCFKAAVGKVLRSTFFHYHNLARLVGGNSSTLAELASETEAIPSPDTVYAVSRGKPALLQGGEHKLRVLGHLHSAAQQDYKGKEHPSSAHGKDFSKPSRKLETSKNSSSSLRRPMVRTDRSGRVPKRKLRFAREKERRDDWSIDGVSEAMVTELGFADGFDTALGFARFGFSKLGFVHRWIHDSLTVLKADGFLFEGEEETYAKYFRNGLRAGEEAVQAVLNAL